VAAVGAAQYTWAGSTADPRGLSLPAGGRLAATWYADTFALDVNLTDGQTHRVGVYLLDWDAQGRSARVDVVDAATGAVLDSRTASAFQGGTYLSWDLGGHVRLVVTNTGGANAVVSGLFFGGA
jgi:hypothetical protein